MVSHHPRLPGSFSEDGRRFCFTPRTPEEDPVKYEHPGKLDKEAKQKLFDDLWGANLTAIRRETLENGVDESPLWMVANRYFRKGVEKREPGLTLVFTHGNGFCKELWEPTLASLLSSHHESRIEEIWALDLAHQGDSGFLNRDVLGRVHDCIDGGRDILQFLLSYLPDSNSTPNTILPPRPLTEPYSPRSTSGLHTSQDPFPNPSREWRGRKIVVIGHSVGGLHAGLALSALPSLFYGTVLVDPVIFTQTYFPISTMVPIITGALLRPNGWSSREEAKNTLLRDLAGFFRPWTKASVDRYIEFGVGSVPTPESSTGETVWLKCSPVQEASTYADSYRRITQAYNRLEAMGNPTPMSASIPPTKIILAERGFFRDPRQMKEMVEGLGWMESAKIKSGHCIPMEKPEEMAKEIWSFLHRIWAKGMAKL